MKKLIFSICFSFIGLSIGGITANAEYNPDKVVNPNEISTRSVLDNPSDEILEITTTSIFLEEAVIDEDQMATTSVGISKEELDNPSIDVISGDNVVTEELTYDESIAYSRPIEPAENERGLEKEEEFTTTAIGFEDPTAEYSVTSEIETEADKSINKEHILIFIGGFILGILVTIIPFNVYIKKRG